MSSTTDASSIIDYLNQLPTDVWTGALLPAFAESGMRALLMFRCACKAGGSFPPQLYVAAVKGMFPRIVNWPDRSNDADQGAAFFIAMARRYFTDPAPFTMVGAGIVMYSAQQMYGMRMYNEHVDPVIFLARLFGYSPGGRFMISRAGRNQLLQVLVDGARDQMLFHDQIHDLRFLAQAVRDLVRDAWAVTLNADGELVIGGWE